MALQIEADRKLLVFSTYEEYLDSLVTSTDINNLQSTVIARKIAELGYRTSGDTLSREQFYKRLSTVREHFFPTQHPLDVKSEGIEITDPALQLLAAREFGNRVGSIATIIFMRCFTKKGFEISGYIDYAERLEKERWQPYFEGKKKIWPRPDDLCYYDWHTNLAYSRDTKNFETIINPSRGLLFKCKLDRKIVCVDPGSQTSDDFTTTRFRVSDDKYEHFILYDHVVRRSS